ncbi:MAG: ribonuclease Z [Oscillospiraceae bacterium]|nr:ribonuclease Z [Oscillospiraceae bacterium]
MNIITVIDDGGGLMFNHRRQSQDRILRERILALSDGSRLWMNAYTRKQFDNTESDAISVDEDFLRKAPDGDFCFVENVPLLPVLERVERVILFRWNRAYPSDMKLDLDLSAPPWTLVETVEFPGYSHEKITEEVYVREEA